jgi:hypothetical protein
MSLIKVSTFRFILFPRVPVLSYSGMSKLCCRTIMSTARLVGPVGRWVAAAVVSHQIERVSRFDWTSRWMILSREY